jgi:Domain of unknown function (DUF1877)
MSIIGNFLRLPPEQLQSILAKPSTILELLYPEDDSKFPSENHLNIEKAWSILHFLFTGTMDGGEGLLANVVLGGSEIPGVEVGYGNALYLTVAEVSQVYAEIVSLTGEELWSKFNLAAATRERIYAFDLDDLESEKDYTIDYFRELQEFYRLAYEDEQAVIKYMN